MNRSKKILVIIDKWPCKEHPYFVYQFIELKKTFKNLRLFTFFDGDEDYYEGFIDRAGIRDVLQNRLKLTAASDYLKYLFPFLFRIIFNLSSIAKMFSETAGIPGGKLRLLKELYVYQALLGKRWDLVHINCLQAARHFHFVTLLGAKTLLISSRGQDFDLYPSRYDKAIKNADFFHAVSNYAAGQLQKKGIPKEKIFVIRPAIDIRRYIHHAKTAGRKILQISTAARLSWTKGHQFILRALALFREKMPEVEFIYHLIGDGPEKDKLFLEAKRLGISENIHFWGWVPEPQAAELIGASDFYILLSVEEAFNNSVLLAQGLGVPCIVSNAGGLPENVIHNDTGFVVSPHDSEAIVSIIVKLLTDQEAVSNLRGRAMERIKNEFNVQRLVEEFSELYEKI